MINIEEYRARQMRQPTRWSSVLSTAAAAAGAFVVGGFAVLNWDRIPGPNQWMSLLSAPAEADNKLSFSGNRIGRSETSALLKICVTKDLVLDVDSEREIDPAKLFQSLVSARNADRLTAVMGAPRDHGTVELAAKWASVADCVFRSNSWGLCDIDNRALAIQAANIFLVQADQIASKPENYSANQSEVGIPDAGEKPRIGFHARPCEKRRADCLRFHTVSTQIGTPDPCQIRPRKKCLR